MTTQTVNGMSVAAAPRVNLMPPEIAEAEKLRRFKLVMGGVVAGAAIVVAVLYTDAHHNVSVAQSALADAQAQETSTQAQVSQLQFVANAYQQVASAKSLLGEAMSGDIRWSYYLEDLSLRIPDNVWLTSMAVSPGASGAASSATAGGSPTGAATPSVIAPADQVATITFGGVALSHDDVAKWLTAIAAEKGWSDPFVTTITESKIGATTVYDWTGTVYVTSKALSGRFSASGS